MALVAVNDFSRLFSSLIPLNQGENLVPLPLLGKEGKGWPGLGVV